MAKYLVTVDHKEGEEVNILEILREFGEVEKYEPPVAVQPDKASARDAYGNPYDKSAASSTTHDAYGNPYVK